MDWAYANHECPRAKEPSDKSLIHPGWMATSDAQEKTADTPTEVCNHALSDYGPIVNIDPRTTEMRTMASIVLLHSLGCLLTEIPNHLFGLDWIVTRSERLLKLTI
jgi:hypothetical protein